MGWAHLWRPIPAPIVLRRRSLQTGLNVSRVCPSALALPPWGDLVFASSQWQCLLLRRMPARCASSREPRPRGQRRARGAALPPRLAGPLRLGVAEPRSRWLPRHCPLRTESLLTISAPREESEETGRERERETLAEICELRLDFQRR